MSSGETTPTPTSHANENQKPLKLFMLVGDGLELGVNDVGSYHHCKEAQGTGGPTRHHRIHGGDCFLLVLSLSLLSPINLMQQNNVEIVGQALGLVCSLICAGNFNIKS